MKCLQRWFAILMALAIALVGVAVPMPAGAASAPFYDVMGGPYDEAVGALHTIQVVNGRSATEFGTAEPVTRAEMAALLVRALGKSDEAARHKGEAAFKDVSGSHWAAGDVVVASELGLVRGGTDGRFRPSDAVTYKEVATMLVRAAGYDAFVTGEWPTGHILQAKKLGILDGTRFEMDTATNRGETALMIYNWIFRVPHPATQKTLNQTAFQVPAGVHLYPDTEHVAIGRTPVRVSVVDAAGHDLEVGAILSATGGSVSGRYLSVPDGVASVDLRATVGDLSVTRTYTVVKDLQIEPGDSLVAPGDKVTLKATAVPIAGGGRVAVKPQWSVTGDAIIDDDGVVEVSALARSNVIVTASLGDASVTARVVVATALTLTPANPVAAPGTPLQLSVALPGGSDALPGITWSTDSGATITKDGKFSSSSPGVYTVTARYGGATGTTRVTVPDTVIVEPDRAVLRPGESQKFHALARYGSGTPVGVNATWSLTGNIGTVSQTGVVSAGTTPGAGTVNATFGILQASAPVSVAGQAARLQLSLSDTSLAADGAATAQLTVRLVDAAGHQVPVDNQPITFFQSGAGVVLSSGSVLTEKGEAKMQIRAGTVAGNATITAQSGTLPTANAVITLTSVALPAAKIKLSAAPNLIGITTSAVVAMPTVVATLVDVTNQPVTASAAYTVNLKIEGNGAVVPTGTITIPAGVSSGSTSIYVNTANWGAVNVTGTSTMAVESTFISLTTAGPAAKLQAVPTRSTAPADGATPIPVDVLVVDAGGVLRTQDSSIVVTLDVINSSGSTQSYSGTTTSGVARILVPAQAAGTYTLRPRTATLPAGADVSVTFNGTWTGGSTGTVGAAYGLEISVSPPGAVAGNPVTVQVRVKDGVGTLMSSDSNRSVTLQANGGTGLLLVPGSGTSGTTSTVNGIATFTLNSAVAQSVALTATTTGLPNPVATGTATWTAPGGSSTDYHLRLKVQDDQLVRLPGSSFTITAEVVDANNNLVTSDSGRTVYLVPSSSLVQIANSSAQTSGGRAVFAVQASGAGTVTFSAGSSDGLVTLPPALSVTFTSGGSGGGTGTTAAKLRLTAATTTTVSVGQPVTLKAQVLDSANNVVSGDNGRSIMLVLPGGVNAFSTTGTTVNGEAIFVVYPTLAGTPSLQAASISGSTLAQDQAVTLTASAATLGSPAKLGYVWDRSAGVTNQPATLWVYVADANDRVVYTDSGRTVSLTALAGTAGFSPASAGTAGGVATIQVTPTIAPSGTLVLSANTTGLTPAIPVLPVSSSSGSGSTTYKVKLLAAASVSANTPFSLFVWLYDANDNPVTTPTVPVTLSLPSGITRTDGSGTTINSGGYLTLTTTPNLIGQTVTISGTSTYSVQGLGLTITP